MILDRRKANELEICRRKFDPGFFRNNCIYLLELGFSVWYKLALAVYNAGYAGARAAHTAELQGCRVKLELDLENCGMNIPQCAKVPILY